MSKIRITKKLLYVKKGDLQLWDDVYGNNPRVHPPEQINKLVESLRQFGVVRPLLIDGNKVVIAGNGTLQAARQIDEMPEVPCIQVSGLTEAEKKKYVAQDNLLYELGKTDDNVLVSLLSEVQAGGEDISSVAISDELMKRIATQADEMIERGMTQLQMRPPPKEEGDGEKTAKQIGDVIIPRDPGERARGDAAGFVGKTPLVYHGGKTAMLPYIMPLVHSVPHSGYVEPFAGGAAVFWARRQPAQLEVLNDMSDCLIAFWACIKSHFTPFKDLVIERGLYSEEYHTQAKNIVLGHVRAADKIEQGWAIFYASAAGFYHSATGGFFLSYEQNLAENFQTKIDRLTRVMCERMKLVNITKRPALELVNKFIDPRLLLYIDPPYIGAEQGSYYHFDEEDLKRLLHAMAASHAKFILSYYPNPHIDEFIERYGWLRTEISMANTFGTISRDEMAFKREQLVFNFKPVWESAEDEQHRHAVGLSMDEQEKMNRQAEELAANLGLDID